MSAITGYPVMADRTIQEKDYYWIWQGRTGSVSYTHLELEAYKEKFATPYQAAELGYIDEIIYPCLLYTSLLPLHWTT